MKRFGFKAVLSLLLMLAVLMSLPMAAYAAESTVTFENSKLVAFAPGSVYTSTDLFENFKGVMPGDVRSEIVTVQNECSGYDYIKVYMRAILHDESGNPISDKVLAELSADERRAPETELEYMYDFLSRLSMTVYNGSSVIYSASPDELDGLVSNVYLGTIRKGQTITLNVQLSVPLELSNEYSDRIGEVDWVFVVEAFDDAPSPTSAPTPTSGPWPTFPTKPGLIQTGQLNWPVPVLGALGLALIAYGIIILIKKRKKDRA